MDNNNEVFATNKIIALVAFVCAALMTSVFLVHMRNKPVATTVANNNGTTFSVPRDIKPFELLAGNNTKFTEKNFQQHWTLVFFGFTHCASICPSTLSMMNRAYAKLHNAYPNLQVVLISLDSERDTPETVAKYSQSFNSDFIGVSGKIQELRKIQSQFGIYSAKDMGSNPSNYQIQHTASIMLINPQGKWAGIFNYGMNPAQFAKIFTESAQPS